MTTSSTTIRNDYTGNASATSFAYQFKIFSDTEISVFLDGVLQLTSAYTVTGVGDNSGGNVVFSSAPASGVKVSLLANPAFTQQIDYVEADSFPAESHEEGLDRAVIRDLSILEKVNRALVLPVETTGVSPELAAPEASTLIGWNSDADGLQNYNVASTDILVPSIASKPLHYFRSNATGNGVDLVRELVVGVDSPPYNAAGDGVTDDYTAIQTAMNNVAAAGGGLVMLGAGKKYLVGTKLIVPSRVVLAGFYGSDLNDGCSEIIGALSLASIVELNGGGGNESCGIKQVVINRAAGTVPASSEGLTVAAGDHVIIDDVMILRSNIGLKIESQLGIYVNRLITTQITGSHVWLEGVVECHFNGWRAGRNGAQDVASDEYLRIKGTAVDTVNIIGGVFANSNGNTSRAIYFDDYENTNGIINITNCHFEGGLGKFMESSATLDLRRLQIHATTVSMSPDTKPLFDLAADSVVEVCITGCASLNGTISLDGVGYLNITGNNILGDLTIDNCSGAVVGNTVLGDQVYTGVSDGLIATGNVSPATGATITNTTSGKAYVFGNGVNNTTTNDSLVAELPEGAIKLGTSPAIAVKYITGTLDGSGQALPAHGISSGQLKILVAQAWYKGASGEMKDMTCDDIDGTNVFVSSADPSAANADYRLALVYLAGGEFDANW